MPRLSVSWVRLQRVPPDIRILTPGLRFFSKSSTRRPSSAARKAATRPAAPAPSTTTSNPAAIARASRLPAPDDYRAATGTECATLPAARPVLARSRPMTTDLGELRRAAAGLHLPGSPAPLEVFDWTSLTDAEPSDAAVQEHAGFPPDAVVARQAVDELFRGLGGRFDGLLGVLRKQLRDLRVYRVGG